MEKDVTYEITKRIGVLSERRGHYQKEVNLVSWNGGPEKIDLRGWDEDHERMTKGTTLTKAEAQKLRDLLNELELWKGEMKMKIREIRFRQGAVNGAEWDPQTATLNVVAAGGAAEDPEGLVKVIAECVAEAAREDEVLFIPLKEASRRLSICIPTLQGYARTHYEGFPAVRDQEGGAWKVNARMLPEWADRITQKAIEGRVQE